MKRLNVGVLGLGVGRAHVEAFRALPSCKVKGVADLSSEKLYEVRTSFPDIEIFSENSDQLLDDPSIDIISIATYDSIHAQQVLKALRRKKHVFVEKPICTSLAELREIQEAVRLSPDLMLSSNLILRKNPLFARIKEMLTAGAFGAPYLFEGDYNYGRIEKITGGWRSQEKNYSVICGGAVHIVDLMRWWIGRRVVEVCAYGTQVPTRNSSFKFNDTVVALLKFDDNTLGKIGANFGCVYPHFHRLQLYGTLATFEHTPAASSLFSSRDKNAPPQSLDSGPAPHKGALISEFVESIVTGEPPPITKSDIFETMAVCLAIDRSLDLGEKVTVAYD